MLLALLKERLVGEAGADPFPARFLVSVLWPPHKFLKASRKVGMGWGGGL